MRHIVGLTYCRHCGKPGSILVAQASTLTMNPSLPERVEYAPFAALRITMQH